MGMGQFLGGLNGLARPSSSSLETAATWMALHLPISLQCSKLCIGNPWDSING